MTGAGQISTLAQAIKQQTTHIYNDRWQKGNAVLFSFRSNSIFNSDLCCAGYYRWSWNWRSNTRHFASSLLQASQPDAAHHPHLRARREPHVPQSAGTLLIRCYCFQSIILMQGYTMSIRGDSFGGGYQVLQQLGLLDKMVKEAKAGGEQKVCSLRSSP